ncbi:MAG TPA: phenylalanine 4-monooxygenase [Gemmatimonadales bacterium]|nr:phenylalanine 4-monooxygenase [Gemmatimonadales bacterium]
MEIAEQPIAPVEHPFIAQEWSRYSDEDHEVWSLLYARRMEQLERTASQVFLDGAKLIGLAPDQVPDLARVNQRLAHLTGWAAVPVKGFLPAPQFFACLAERRFPTTVTVRPKSALDYVPEPDIFHDVFGHVPLHAHAVFAEALEQLGRVGSETRTPGEIERITRLFWFTVEFGLVREAGEIRIYGSGLISSHGDAANALGTNCRREPFDLDQVVSQPFEIDRLQPVLFVLESFEELFEAVRRL